MGMSGEIKMRKIVAGLFQTLDGVVESPEKWQFASYWPHQPSETPFADYMNATSKLVVSTTLDTVEWQNSTLISGDVVTELTKLTQQPGKNLNITGSLTLVRSLLREGLLDELRVALVALGIHIGAGMDNPDADGPRGRGPAGVGPQGLRRRQQRRGGTGRGHDRLCEGQFHCRHGAIRVRQEHPAADRGRAGPADVGVGRRCLVWADAGYAGRFVRERARSGTWPWQSSSAPTRPRASSCSTAAGSWNAPSPG